MHPPRIELSGVRRTFRGGAGVHGVDLSVAPGEIHALVGLNGAGKTTLMRLMLGMLRPDGGDVRIDGTRIDELPASAWASVGHLVEQALAYGELDVRDNLRLVARLHGAGRAQAATMADASMEELNLGRYAHVRVRRLSLGNRQRVGLAAALQHDPALIVLDEPTNALDPAGVIRVREAVLRRAAAGAGVLVSSHHLDEVARVAHRISVLNEGRLIGALDPGAPDLERAFFALVLADDLNRGSA
ncbi:ABC transporter ATP-binding protein [Agromyces aerolatus]|uniref:ABC transporter ATP-binding protein n=1 Tax=Agromyces sp. LY-1074 TaxID=3074080 RepID=UPI0028562A0E|nr:MULTISPECIES: ABC transporter ATP-binding protein [unclassified Agromyces]MDR5700917.1 ABC transporter ATP-binding protein [Agromyces sp. LY-1074]MDR5707422.1 ABC transporter ATP-binding protein [Agromyces sp. LY-1358]